MAFTRSHTADLQRRLWRTEFFANTLIPRTHGRRNQFSQAGSGVARPPSCFFVAPLSMVLLSFLRTSQAQRLCTVKILFGLAQRIYLWIHVAVQHLQILFKPSSKPLPLSQQKARDFRNSTRIAHQVPTHSSQNGAKPQQSFRAARS